MISLKQIYDFILDFVFTKRCRFCHAVCSITDDVCESCVDDISKISGDICFKCGCDKTICSCNRKAHFYESVCAPYYYEGAPRKAVIALKHKNTPQIAEALSEDMVSCIKERYSELSFDACTFVPMHKKDEKKRGYNQAHILAEKIAESLDIPCFSLINKDYETQSQHILSEALRRGNLSGALSFNDLCEQDITDMRILLCDDIKTTGATLDECAKILLFAGAAEVRCVSACITKPLTRQTPEKQMLNL